MTKNKKFALIDCNNFYASCERVFEPKLEEDANSSAADNDQAEEETEDTPADLKEAFDRWNLEAAVLSNNTGRKCLYRALSESEISALKSEAIR